MSNGSEIKFKVWLPGIKKMTYPHTLEELMNWGTEKWTNGTAEFLRYTGMTDKNGKEIFEGDIIHIQHPHRGRTYTGPIIYDAPTFTADGFYFPHHDNPGDPFESLEYMEVIGNIYENTEFLKDSGTTE